MADPMIWNPLPRTNNDPTSIDEAIAAAVDSHNNDPDAHYGPDQALEVHRENPVIDHLAESVVNDKLRVNARQYVAIVDTESETDFDTLAAAVEYADGKGGGTIYLAPGTHYISGTIHVAENINLVGSDSDSTILIGGSNAGNQLQFVYLGTNYNALSYVTGIGFSTTGGALITEDISGDYVAGWPVFTDCFFFGGGEYIRGMWSGLRFVDCRFQCNNTYALSISGPIEFENCTTTPVVSANSRRFLQADPAIGGEIIFKARNCIFGGSSSWNSAFINGAQIVEMELTNCFLVGLGAWLIVAGDVRIYNSVFNLAASGYLSFAVPSTIFTGCRVFGGTGNRVRLTAAATKSLVVGNQIATGVTNSSTGSVVANNVVL